jgi:hypothetical protein
MFLLSFTSYSQTTEIPLNEKTITAPIGLSFGMSVAQVKAAMAKKGAILDAKYSKKDRLIFNNVKVGPKTTDFIKLLFVDDKLFDVTMYYNEIQGNLQKGFDQLKETLENKYGSGEYYRNFDSPYKDGDGYEMQAIKLGKGYISSYWTFKNASISLEIDETLAIKLGYQDSELSKIYFDRKKAKEASDL